MYDLIYQFNCIINGSAEYDTMDLILWVFVSLLFWSLFEIKISCFLEKIWKEIEKRMK